jgi:hypothetical protein
MFEGDRIHLQAARALADRRRKPQGTPPGLIGGRSGEMARGWWAIGKRPARP